MFTLLIFFNEARTDYLARGPYKTWDAAARALEHYRGVFKAALAFEVAGLEMSEAETRR